MQAPITPPPQITTRMVSPLTSGPPTASVNGTPAFDLLTFWLSTIVTTTLSGVALKCLHHRVGDVAHQRLLLLRRAALDGVDIDFRHDLPLARFG